MNNLFDVSGKVALVTGGTSGIGFMIATGLVEVGAKVYVVSRKLDAVHATVAALSQKGQCVGIAGDVSSEEGIQRIVSQFKESETKLNILVNCAGATWGGAFDNYPDKAWDRIMNLNVRGAFNLIRELTPLLETAGTASDPARIINITSVAGQLTASMQAYAYGPSKAALNHLTRILANEMAYRHINVNAIAPGFFPSKMTAFITQNEALEQAQAEQIPLKRLGKPEDIAGLVIFLSSRAGAYMTGNIIPLDGGLSVKAV